MQQSSGNLLEQILSAAFDVFRGFHRFNGRSTRSALIFGYILIGSMVIGLFMSMAAIGLVAPPWLAPLLTGCLSGALLIRRLHDADFSGWWLLGPLMLIPASLYADYAGVRFPPTGNFNATVLIDVSNLGWIAKAVLLPFISLVVFWPGTAGDNRFSPNPRSAVEPDRQDATI